MPEIQNPNQQPGGFDSKSMLSMMLVFLLVFLGLTWYRQRNNNAEAPKPVENSQAQTAPAATPAVNAPGAAASGANAALAQNAAGEAATTQASAETQTVIENELYRITFTNRGARVSSWILKRYNDDNGHPLDLVNSAASKQAGYPLTLWVNDAGLRSRINDALFVATPTSSAPTPRDEAARNGAPGVNGESSAPTPRDEAARNGAPGVSGSPNALAFDYAANGLHVRKEFRFDQSYVIHATATVTNNGTPVQAALMWPAALGDDVTSQLYASSQVDTAQGGSVTHLAPKKITSGQVLQGPFDWAGISDLYFAAIFLPDTPANASVVTLRDAMNIPRDPKDPGTKYDNVPVLGAGVGDRNAGAASARLYAGPKALDILKTVHAAGANDNIAAGAPPTGENLEPLEDFGFWGFIAKPLFLWLHWTYDHLVRNWGWAIIVLTLIINIALLPMRISSMRTALKMQRIQPEMNAIKAKYKAVKITDPRHQQMQQEIAALQKREGVNMLGSCLPTLIQFPLLIAFYSMLGKAIDLRQAHWLWLPDLSRPDPLHILPVFFIVSMFLMQYMTPSPGMDPAQRKMMAFMMPAMFGFWTWTVASGVALYWAGSNVVGVIQQVAMNRSSLGQQMRAIAAKRARRKAGQGKMIEGKR